MMEQTDAKKLREVVREELAALFGERNIARRQKGGPRQEQERTRQEEQTEARREKEPGKNPNDNEL